MQSPLSMFRSECAEVSGGMLSQGGGCLCVHEPSQAGCSQRFYAELNMERIKILFVPECLTE